MKKLMTFVLTAVLAASLYACQSAAPSPTVAQPTPEPTVESTSTPEATLEATEEPTAPDTTGQDPGDTDSLLGELFAGVDITPLTGWPTDLPEGIPEFGYGTLLPDQSGKMTVAGNLVYAMSYSGVTKDNIDAYGESLEPAFTVSSAEAAGVYTLTGIKVETDGSMTMVIAMLATQDICIVEVMPNYKAVS
jgi:hypothetical protein